MAATARLWMWLAVTMVCFLVAASLLFSVVAYAMRSNDFRYKSGAQQLALVLNMYAYDTGSYPALTNAPRLMFETAELYPDFTGVAPLYFLISPAEPLREQAYSEDPAYFFEHCSYMYLGYAVWDDDSVQAFAEACRKHRLEGRGLDNKLSVERPYQFIERLDHMKAGNWRSEATEHVERKIPLLIERPRPYPGAFGLWVGGPVVPLSRSVVGGCVVYQDGQLEFLEYPGKWPMTETTIGALVELERGAGD